jgi:hypothetical protein
LTVSLKFLPDEWFPLGRSATVIVFTDTLTGRNVPNRKDDTDLCNCSIWISIDRMPGKD